MSEREPRRARVNALDQPREHRPGLLDRFRPNPDAFGKWTEGFARFMGTPQFLLWMTVFVVLWLAWNTLAPESAQFDPRALNFTLLTLMLSLQASYAAPLRGPGSAASGASSCASRISSSRERSSERT